MAKAKKILDIIPKLEELNEEQIDLVYDLAKSCLLVNNMMRAKPEEFINNLQYQPQVK